ALKTAAQHFSANRLNQAEQIYRRILEILSEQPDALHGLGLLTFQKGEFQNAKEFLEAAVRIQPNVFKHWLALGNTHQSQGEFSQAVNAYEKALAAGCNIAPLYNNLGYALQKLGNWEKAIASYHKALELQPDCQEAYVNLGNALYAQGQLSKDKQADYAQLNHQLGLERKQAGDLNNAIAYYQQAIDLYPQNWEYYYNLAIVLQEQKQFEKAIYVYKQALEINPQNWDIYNHLGQIYQAQKNLTEALSIYRQALTVLNPNYASAIKTHPNCFIETTPSVPQSKVKIGAYDFPAIAPLREPLKPRPFWTVVIPVYNRTDYVLESLASVLLQWTGEADMEILVMDNASTESSIHELINSLAGGIVRYYRNSENVGCTNNMNLGMSLSRGEWVHVLHDDDSVCPGFYSQLQESLKDCPDSVGAACSGFQYMNEYSEAGRIGEMNLMYKQQTGVLTDFLP
ncbi:MAG: tetratricopeptide repeat protein, partial [Cyanobacteria bacterium J06649_11]